MRPHSLKSLALRASALAFVASLFLGTACGQDMMSNYLQGCNPEKGTENPYLREQDRICAPGTRLDQNTRQCVRQ